MHHLIGTMSIDTGALNVPAVKSREELTSKLRSGKYTEWAVYAKWCASKTKKESADGFKRM